MHNPCFRVCRGSRDQQEYYSLSQTDINAAFYLRISMPKRQKTFFSSLGLGRLYTGVCSTFCTSQLTWPVQNRSKQHEYIKTYAWSCTLRCERNKLCCNIRFIPVQNIRWDFTLPSLTNPSWTMEEPNWSLPFNGDLFLEEGLLSPRTKSNPSGRTKWRKSSLQGRNSTSVKTAALLLL